MNLTSRPPGPGPSQETWARGTIRTRNACRWELFTEGETESPSDPHACDVRPCASESSCQMLLTSLLLIGYATQLHKSHGRGNVARRGAHTPVSAPVPRPSHRATQGLRGGSAHLEDLSRGRVFCRSQVQTRTGNKDAGRNGHSTVLSASHVGLSNPTTMRTPILQASSPLIL